MERALKIGVRRWCSIQLHQKSTETRETNLTFHIPDASPPILSAVVATCHMYYFSFSIAAVFRSPCGWWLQMEDICIYACDWGTLIFEHLN
jgi:hypothetical protein